MFLTLILGVSYFLLDSFLGPVPEPELEVTEMSVPEEEEGAGGYSPDSLFPFDPNELPKDGWKSLGLTEEQASVLINYRKSGGRFYERSDLSKVYSIRKEHLKAWEGYMKFPEKGSNAFVEGSSKALEKGEGEEGTQEEEQSFEPFPFDPNKVTVEELSKLGLSEKQAEVLIEYRDAGGRFWEAADLLELYVVDSALYREWRPYVRIDREALKVPIDRANAEALKGLTGIGKVRAERIVEYRELLGGYRNLDQLKEVYGLPDSLVQRLRPQVKVAGPELDPLSLDLPAKELMAHPYISPELAEAIVQHRERYGGFSAKEELKALDLLDDEGYRKIAPYLELPSDEER